MALMGTLRRRLLTPNSSETSFDVRGFHAGDPEARRRMETVGRYFLVGYAAAAQAARPLNCEPALREVPTGYRGFAYEGAAMAFAVRDGLPVGGRNHVTGFLDGAAHRHIYMVYVGVGWAMARIPKFRWRALHAADPLLRWLILDGYGFHQAYFHTRRYVYGQRPRDGACPWPAGEHGWYAPHAVDQGVGRATWFVAGGDPELVTRLFGEFAPDRRADLFSGVGLAATYAGGVERAALERLWDLAGAHRPHLAQGAAFAARARVRADLVMPYNELAAEVFCDMSAADAAKVPDEALVDLPAEDRVPAYATWRTRISDTFAARGRC
ncbi:DUF1702 family protein [Rhizomonospora bruguierae]|uniref:DUF1702 family protein n=1 Tax=Rhizomonospora bruguierae TaxID=1581705 RepID=UPI001BD184C9|nr:DUF1702 family protein [Micromonospora sp. NBRC 107566]